MHFTIQDNPENFYREYVVWIRLWLGSRVETQSRDEEATYKNERTVEVTETLVQLYQILTYYLETCLRIQHVVDSFEKSAKVQYMDDRPAIDYQSSFWRQAWVNHWMQNLYQMCIQYSQKQLAKMESLATTVKA